MKIECSIEDCTIMTARGDDLPGVRVTCSRCEHTAESLGRGEKSKRRCLALLREKCPEHEENFYVIEEPPPQPAWWSEKPPRGEEVSTPAILKNLPLKPPGRT